MQSLSLLLFAAVFFPFASSAVVEKRSLSGQATFYGGNLAGGACSFSTYTLPSGVFGTALSDSNWDNSGNCGACVSVTGPSGNSITAMIVDECPGCGMNHLDLFPDAFAALAQPSKGVIDVSWNYVDCPISSPLELHNKDGVSQYWFSMQAVNANKAVASLDVSTNGGSAWQSTDRQGYNFFQQSSGFGTATVDVKVTSVDGDVVVVKNVEVSGGASTTASSNFGTSGSVAADPPVVAPPPSKPASTSSTVTAEATDIAPPTSTSASLVKPTTISIAPPYIPSAAKVPQLVSTTTSQGLNFFETSISVAPAPATPSPFEVVIVYATACDCQS